MGLGFQFINTFVFVFITSLTQEPLEKFVYGSQGNNYQHYIPRAFKIVVCVCVRVRVRAIVVVCVCLLVCCGNRPMENVQY